MRLDIFHKFEQHLAEQSPWIWLSTSYSYTAQLKTVQGFEGSPTGTLFALAHVTVGG